MNARATDGSEAKAPAHAPAIHQLTHGFTPGDAISNDILELQRILRSWGCRSEVFADSAFTSPILRGIARDYREFEAEDEPDAAILFHFSIGTRLTEWFAGRRAHKLIKYHNITPAHFFAATDPRTARALEHGRRELARFAGVPELALAASAYSARELIEAGYRRTGVLPNAINFAGLDEPPDPAMLARLSDNAVNVLFVGRVTPNKKFEDVIKTFAFYKKLFNPDSQLILAGDYRGLERYFASLQEMVGKLRVSDVHFSGHIEFSELLAFYRAADIYLSMSEHEGFGVPILEAFYNRIPVIGFAAGAVEETMNGGGVILREKDFLRAAALVDTIQRDHALREKIVAGQLEALKAFSRENVSRILLDLVARARRG
jgi:glycosyltransferase involved in cell wall biosynthesis